MLLVFSDAAAQASSLNVVGLATTRLSRRLEIDAEGFTRSDVPDVAVLLQGPLAVQRMVEGEMQATQRPVAASALERKADQIDEVQPAPV